MEVLLRPVKWPKSKLLVAVHQGAEGGKRVRRMQCYDFQWSEAYGWDTWEMREERGVDAVWIWSDLKGEMVVS